MPDESRPALAGLSAFGFGGLTHMWLEGLRLQLGHRAMCRSHAPQYTALDSEKHRRHDKPA